LGRAEDSPSGTKKKTEIEGRAEQVLTSDRENFYRRQKGMAIQRDGDLGREKLHATGMGFE